MSGGSGHQPIGFRLALCMVLAHLIERRKLYIQFIERDGAMHTAEVTGYRDGETLTIISDARELLRDAADC